MKEIGKNSLLEWFEKDGNYFGVLKSEIMRIMDKKKIPIIFSGIDGLS